jgi:hypothetical protein
LNKLDEVVSKDDLARGHCHVAPTTKLSAPTGDCPIAIRLGSEPVLEALDEVDAAAATVCSITSLWGLLDGEHVEELARGRNDLS